MKRIVQILGKLAYGDAIGNHVLAIYKELKKRKIETRIYAEKIDQRYTGIALNVNDYQSLTDDVILYHLSYGTPLNRKVCEFDSKLIVNYHNITPGYFFRAYNKIMEKQCDSGYCDLEYMRNRIDFVIGDSDYNLKTLRNIGYSCKMQSIPIVIDYTEYLTQPNSSLLSSLKCDDCKYILFVGRVAPNKKQQYVIEDYYYYQKYFEPKSKLIIAGSYTGNENYYLRLKKYASLLDISDKVIFTGHIPFNTLLAYYHGADVFLCESEHEGFCVPLVEAMILLP